MRALIWIGLGSFVGGALGYLSMPLLTRYNKTTARVAGSFVAISIVGLILVLVAGHAE